jgi:hypothetical protein
MAPATQIRLAAAAALAAAAFGLAACGGSDDDGGASAPRSDPTGSVEAPPGEGGASTGGDSASGGGARADAAQDGDGEPAVYIGAQRGVATDFLAFGAPRIEPERLEVSGDATLVGMSWRGWGTQRATATGDLRVNTCMPTCAEGRIERRAGAEAVVSDLRAGECRADGNRVARFYTRAAVRFPPGLELPARQVVTLFPRCVQGG